MIILDHFPDALVTVPDLDVMPDMRHMQFPSVPIYDIRHTPMSQSTLTAISSNALMSHTYGDYCIPDHRSFHDKNIHLLNEHLMTLIATRARQFALVRGNTNGAGEVVLIRQGARIMMMGGVWKLVIAMYEGYSSTLFYQSETETMPVLLRIVQGNPGYPVVSGEYHLL
jgi:hypothetical protein